MALNLIVPQNPQSPQKFDHFIGENHELVLNQSIQSLLDSHSCDFSAFTTTFYELMQARANPPLETIWVYSALTFRHTNLPKVEPLDRISATKTLFQLISGCSATCSSSKSIGLLAPVIYEVYRVIADFKGKDLGSKREKKVMREIKYLVNAILGYISVCCSAHDDSDGLGLDSEDFILSLGDLIRVWIGGDDEIDDTLESKEMFKLFFPLLGDDIVGWPSVEGRAVSELAGVVITEAFLLRLCLNFSLGVSKQESRIWAIGCITGFQHFFFFETLARMLLQNTLPVISLLSSEDELSLRKLLYDAVILVEYSFLNPDKVIHVLAKHIKSLAITRVVVTHKATELFRKEGDHTKAISYINAFSGSQLPSQLIKLVTSDVHMDSKAGQPKGLSPKALLKWLFKLEGLGIRVLDDGIAENHSRLVLDISEFEHEQQAYNTERTKPDADLFYIDEKGEEEDGSQDDERTNESMSAAFVAAAHTLTSSTENGRKRKEKGSVEKKKRVKFLKYNLSNNTGSSGEKSTFLRNSGSSSGSEVDENPRSDEDLEEKEN
ncbi:hypothetical protein LOK49_LG03G01243 [Camellia lanceoleosa]|uniref:Uncharacterized protein n=1 Tax=Camellia lanceoleosa TaxID=1840588 RepID=A0ACC0I9X3_9ERIC|nr:hypothetical protein LOK49_LG03G01243 [Camellia lanceoleosa]